MGSYNHIVVLENPILAKTCNLPRKLCGFFGNPVEGRRTRPQDGKVKLGVQLTPLEEVIKNNKGKFFIRKIVCEDELYDKTFHKKIWKKFMK